MTSDDVPDSTDWLSTPLSGLTAVEASLRCQVCKDFYRTPMLTSCSHTFCSLCIRRALSSDGKCPLCRAPEQEMKLRSNWAMEETIDAFTKSRAQFLKVATAAKEAESARSPKRSREDVNGEGEPETKRTRTSARLSKKAEEAPLPVYRDQMDQDAFIVPDSDDENDVAYEPDPGDGLVACPVCGSRMKEWLVFKHLESCPGSTPKRNTGESSIQPRLNTQKRQTNAERLPALAYGMLKDNALRKKMQDLGLHTWGTRQNLELRHKEWITLWNANCDAAIPKKTSELLRELDVWERTQGGAASNRNRLIANGTAVKDKDFDGAGWAKTHDDSFKDLIASARRSRQEAQKKVSQAKEEVEKATRDRSTKPNPESAVQSQNLVCTADYDGREDDDERLKVTSLLGSETCPVDSNNVPESETSELRPRNITAGTDPRQPVPSSGHSLVLGQSLVHPPDHSAQTETHSKVHIPRQSQEPFTESREGHRSRQADIENTARYMQQVQGSTSSSAAAD